ncbi:MAG: response regulator [Planctomycetes bacterium]|nr:response regulator [Planctomycetota bacterium]
MTKPPLDTPKANGAPHRGLAESSILLVDDREQDLLALEAILEPLGATLVRAKSGEEALRYLLNVNPSVILLDVQLPGMSGFEAAELIRSREKTRYVPIIFLTGVETTQASHFKAYSVGAVDYMVKPVQPEVLRSKVSVFVELQRMAQQVRLQAEHLRRMEEREHNRLLQRITNQRNRMFALAGDLMGIASLDEFLKEVNPSWETTLGWTQAELLGRPLADYVHPDDRKAHEAVWARLRDEPGTHQLETRMMCADGSHRWIAWAATRPPDAEAVYTVGHDVTSRREAEQSIRRMNEELERRVSERTAELQSAVRELEGFTYSVSHDLRAPLRAIEGFSRFLVESHSSQLDGEGHRLLGVVRENSRRMGRLIDDLLEFSRTGRAELSKARVDIAELARETVEQLQQDIGKRDVDFQVEDLPPALCDRSLMRQVFLNLVGNSVKYSAPRARAVIEIGALKDGTYYVRDNGVGFDPQYTHKLFGVFQRLHTAEEFEGTGVGLALVQRIVQRHGGKIWAEGAVNQGATFYFTLPGSVNA